jgi:hypothetical protein
LGKLKSCCDFEFEDFLKKKIEDQRRCVDEIGGRLESVGEE